MSKGNRHNKKGLYSIYLRVIIDRRAYYFNLDKKVDKIHWQGKDHVWIKSSFRNSSLVNIFIKRKVEEMATYVQRLEAFGHHVTIEHFKQVFEKKSVGTFNDFITDYMRSQVKGLKVNTIKKYNTFQRYLNEYNKAIAFQVINENFIFDFCHWLSREKTLHGSTIHKYMDPFKKIVRQAFKEGYFERDPFYKVTIPYSEKRKNKKEYLSILEIKKIKDTDIPEKRIVLEKVREWFLFSFYCGIRYKDLQQLQWKDFVVTDQGLCLYGSRVKNGNDYHVPLYMSKHALDILEKRRQVVKINEDVFSDTISEQKYNGHLKDLAELCSITKNLKNSSARDAFGKFWARKGVPRQHLAKMMGHDNEVTTSKYYDIDGDDINEHLGKMQSIGLFKIDF